MFQYKTFLLQEPQPNPQEVHRGEEEQKEKTPKEKKRKEEKRKGEGLLHRGTPEFYL